MKPVRLVLIGTGVLVLLLLLVVAAAFTSPVQTWAVRKALAGQPSLHASVGSVSAGLHRVVVRDVRFEQDGAVFTAPALEAELPLFAAGMRKQVFVTRLVSTGWTLDLSKIGTTSSTPPAGAARPAPPTSSSPAPSRQVSPVTSADQAFRGIFNQLALPVELSLDGVQAEGDVVLPESRGRVKVSLRGGGLGAGRQGKFDLTAAASLADRNVSALNLRGALAATMDTPRTFTGIAATFEVSATGTSVPQGARLAAEVSAARSVAGEDYVATLVGDGRPLVNVKARLPVDARRLDGTWKLDLRDRDLSPFALGIALPEFTAVGDGRFDLESNFVNGHAAGKLDATAARLEAIRPELGAIGAVKAALEFDATRRGDALTVDRLNATVASSRPVATVGTLQPLTVDVGKKTFSPTDPTRPLLDVILDGVPLAWTAGALPGFDVTGGDFRGELSAISRGGGIALRSKTPLTIGPLSVAQAGKPLVRDAEVSLNVSADYAAAGWQAELSGANVRSAGAVLLTLDAKAGQLADAGEPLKATGKVSANLPALLAQPVMAGTLALTRGDATVDFVGNLGTKQEIEAKIAVRNLSGDPKAGTTNLPEISADVRADISDDGHVVVHVPLVLEREGRKSDLALAGTLQKQKEKLGVEAQVTSTNFVIDDAKALAALLPPSAPAAEGRRDAPAGGSTPPWAGIEGSVALALKQVVYSDAFQASDVTGTLRLENGSVKLEGVRSGLNQGGEARLDGEVTFDPAAPQPYGLNADLTLANFDPAPLLRALNPAEPATVEGKFDVTSKLAGKAPRLDDLALAAHGDFRLTSKGGVFRGLPVKFTGTVEKVGKLAAGAALIGSAIDALKGRPESSDLTTYSQAAVDFTNMLSAIRYDQLSVVISRDAALNSKLKEFALIAPEMRVTGSGETTHKPGSGVLGDALAMDFTLRARGRTADALKYLGLLEAKPDQLGYFTSTLPLKIKGTIASPDASEPTNYLTNLVIEKSSGLLNKLLGGK
jgi:hypothetical protein